LVRVGRDAAAGRDLLISQALQAAQPFAASVLEGPPEQVGDGLRDLSRRYSLDVGLYDGGALVGVSAPVLADLGVLPALLSPEAYRDLILRDRMEYVAEAPGAVRPLRMGYRVIRPGAPGEVGVLAAPRLSDDSGLGREQLDLAFVLLLAALVGIGAAVVAARLAARALSRPVADLRHAALAVGQGVGAPALGREPPVEFEPVFAAFERMAADVRASQSALEAARRRTATVLSTVATGVVAVDPDGRVLLANPRARELLDLPLVEGQAFAVAEGAELAPLAEAIRRALGGRPPQGPLEVVAGERRLGVEVASLGADPSGVVAAVTDLTDAARAARVLAWGEMARQVAHEIKNPLTPVRLGIQHLRRVHRERPGEFDATFDVTVERILAEIGRLDTIARAFSRFAAPAERAEPLESLDLGAVAADVLHLYRLGEDGATVELDAPAPVRVGARQDELREVLVNLVENARNAGARRIVVTVRPGRLGVTDDGAGIPAELLPRIFEPRFSTTTSGSGLGLSIVKRLVEGWGATVAVTSAEGRGTTATVRFAGGA
jgi:nitrogen fixation/metabolism regulation signal transduction histidine kinase